MIYAYMEAAMNLILVSQIIPAKFADTIYLINMIISNVVLILYLYQNFYAIFAIFTFPKKYKKAEKLHKFGYIICAHDEELVVGNLVESILKQDYPLELMHVFVVADNCTDKTAQVARDAGATVFERFSEKKGKSFALDYVLNKIFNEYDNEGFDALFIFDADNLVAKDYTTRMNDTYEAGFKVATSYRESKNFDKNWITAGSSMLFYRECSLIHHSRSILGLGTFVSGTGFYVDYQYIKSLGGWKYNTMTEDIEFSCDCANNMIKIGYNENALFYDEQPETMKASITQRLRWCKGIHQCYLKYVLKGEGKRTKRFLFTQEKYEMHMHITPLPIFSFTWTILYLLMYSTYIIMNGCSFSDFFMTAAIYVLWFLFTLTGMAWFHAFVVTAKRWKQIQAPLWKQILYCLCFPIFSATFIPLSIVALFKKVKWTKIDHTESIKIEEIGKK